MTRDVRQPEHLPVEPVNVAVTRVMELLYVCEGCRARRRCGRRRKWIGGDEGECLLRRVLHKGLPCGDYEDNGSPQAGRVVLCDREQVMSIQEVLIEGRKWLSCGLHSGGPNDIKLSGERSESAAARC